MPTRRRRLPTRCGTTTAATAVAAAVARAAAIAGLPAARSGVTLRPAVSTLRNAATERRAALLCWPASRRRRLGSLRGAALPSDLLPLLLCETDLSAHSFQVCVYDTRPRRNPAHIHDDDNTSDTSEQASTYEPQRSKHCLAGCCFLSSCPDSRAGAFCLAIAGRLLLLLQGVDLQSALTATRPHPQAQAPAPAPP